MINEKQQNNRHFNNQNNKTTVLLNQKIKFKTLSVISSNGENLGEMTTTQALSLAESQGLDLLVIAIQQNKVIAKILDYGKHRFEQQKKIKTNKKNQIISKIKEIKVKPLIGEHDLKVRAENAKKWLNQGNKVKFIIEARGRMSLKSEFIDKIYNKFIEMLDGNGLVTQSHKKVNDFRYESIIDPIK